MNVMITNDDLATLAIVYDWFNTYGVPKVKELLSSCFPSVPSFSQVLANFKTSTCLIIFISSSKALRLLLSLISSCSIFICHASFIYSSCFLFLLFLKCCILACIILLVLERIHPLILKP